MPKTRPRSSRPKSRRQKSKSTDTTKSKGNLVKSRSCTRSGRQFRAISREKEDERATPNRARSRSIRRSLSRNCTERRGRSCTRSGREYNSIINEDSTIRVVPSRARSRCKRSSAQQELVQDLRKRIASIDIKGRPIPDTDNLKVLGVELKIRLAATSEVISEYGRRGAKTHVTTISTGRRFVPLWEINRYQDPSLLCQVKVKVVHRKRRKHS